MSIRFLQLLALAVVGGLVSCGSVNSGGVSGPPDAGFSSVAEEPIDPARLQTAVFAGGCFWGVEAVFEHIKGVADAKSGYAGGSARSANYEEVSGGETEHAEAVEVRFDPARVSYEQLLDVFFKVVHDPTELNRQGPDVGPQYRSAIFYVDDAQKNTAEDMIRKLEGARVYKDRVVTKVVPLEKFYDAEEYHQDYLWRHPKDPYIVYHDLPKLENLKRRYPALYFSKKKS